MDLFRIVLPWERQISEIKGQRSEVRRTGVSSARSMWVWPVVVVIALAVLLTFELIRSRSHLEGGALLRHRPRISQEPAPHSK